MMTDPNLATVATWVGRSHAAIDCEQLVIDAYKLRGIELPGLYRAMFKGMFRTVFDPAPWDLIPVANHRLNIITHVGLYLGNQQAAHSFEESGVVVLPLHREPWFSRIARDASGRPGFLRLIT
jgi:cell wall-associated NlpC family hydrolase